MNIDTFFQRFRLVTRAPNGVSRLRELVLQLAVTGRLFVDPEPESLDNLISEIELERMRLTEAGELSPGRPISGVDCASQHTKVPKHWRWMRLGNLTSKIGSGSTPRGGAKVYVSTGVAFLRSQNVWNDGIKLDDVVYISESTHERMKNTRVIANDILLNITGASLGRCTKVPVDFPEANVSQHVTIIRPLLPALRHFLHICLLSPMGQSMIWGRQVGMAREGLSKKVLEQFEIPLPPLEEQQRIVAKVDELMGLCDRLESQLSDRAKLLPFLSRANHDRFVQEPTSLLLQRLFQPSGVSSPDDLRSTVLSLAVRGMLVARSDEDGSGNALLESIHSVNGEVISSSSKARATLPFKIPDSWGQTPLGTLLEPSRIISYGIIKLGSEPKSGGIPVLRCSNVRFRRLDQSGMRNVEKSLSDEYARTILRGGELLVNVRGTLGGCAVVPRQWAGANVAREVAVVPLHPELDPDFVLAVVSSPYFQNLVTESLRGIAYRGLNLKALREFVIPIPPVGEQRRIVRKVQELLAVADQLERLADEASTFSELFSTAAIQFITRIDLSTETMKPPNLEVVTSLKATEPKSMHDSATLAFILAEKIDGMSAKSLWQRSGLEIDRFYAQLKTEIANGWIAEPEPATVKEVEVG